MKFGVNYTPSHGWFHAWLDPDWDGIDNDLKQISEQKSNFSRKQGLTLV